MTSGWIKLYRQIWDCWVWNEKPFSRGQAWIDLLLLANHKGEKFPYKGKVVEGERGTVYRSILYLANRWGWGREKTRQFLKQLESDGMITVKATTHQTTITIVNYGIFQDSEPTDPTADQATSRQQTKQPTDIYKNEKNDEEG